jgi:hypothetical protein
VRKLGYWPLAVNQAAAFTSARKLPLDWFLEHYHERRAAVLKHTPSSWEYRRKLGNGADETPLCVFVTWELSFRQLLFDRADRGRLRHTLTVAAHYNISGVHRSIFSAYCSSATELWLLRMINFASDDGKSDYNKFEAAVAELSYLSLLHYIDKDGTDVSFALHLLVADCCRH